MIINKLKRRLVEKTEQIIFDKFPVYSVENTGTRERWLEAEIAKIPAGSKILDAGAGELDKKKYCGHLDYISQDFAQYDGVGDGAGLQTGSWDQSKIDLVCDIVDIPVENNYFDSIICVEVLEHLPDPVIAISELVRILKPGGTLIITAPFSSLTHFAPYHFCSGFNQYWYEEHFKRLGVTSINIYPNGNYHGTVCQELSRIPGTLKEYELGELTRLEKWAHRIILSRLSKASKVDKASHDLACFGYHVVVIK